VAAFERLARLPAAAETSRRLSAALDAGGPFDLDAATRIVEADLALAVAVLRAANAQRTPSSAIGSIPDAVRALGADGLRDARAGLPSVDVFQRVPGWEVTLEQFRLHAVAAQRAAEHVARALGRTDLDELLVAALLHDVGKLALASAHRGYPSAVHGAATTPEDRLVAERRELGVDHTLAGGVMTRRWRLPEAIAHVAEHHHDPEADGDAALVRLADMLAHHGHGRAVDSRALGALAASLGLGSADLRALMHDLPQGAPRRRASTPSPLSPQETAVLRGLAEGKRYKEIASDLGLSLSTIRSHASAAYTRLGVADRAQAVLTATAQGWI
jgi:putative nucleotidyltransferase with HDIG domain